MLCPKCLCSQEEAEVCVSCGVTLPRLADPLIGRTVGAYNVLRCLGRGGFGAVYEAAHLETSVRVALKILRREFLEEPTAVERFLREAQAAARIEHPRAVKIFDKGTTDDGLLFLAMELISGETLEAHLQRVGHISERELLSLLEPLVEVLSEAHQQGVIHRDIKPPNIMLTLAKEGARVPTLLDFGLSGLRGASPLTSASTVSGTPQYMAPEQWEGLARADARSDLYSLAVVAYQALSGRLPFEADSPLAWLKKHQSEAPLDLRQAMNGRPVSDAVCSALMKALSKAPEERFASAREFWAALSGPYQKQVAPAAKKPLRWIFASLLVTGFVGGGFYWSSLPQETRATTQITEAIKPLSNPSSSMSNATTNVASSKPVIASAPASLASRPAPSDIQETPSGDVYLWASGPDTKEPTEEELLQNIERERKKGDYSEMCALMMEYLSRAPNSPHKKKLIESVKTLDIAEFPECSF